MGDDGTGSDKSITANRHTTDNRTVGAEGGALLHERLFVFILPDYVAARIHDVSEYHRRSAEHVVFQDAAGIDRHVVLNLYVVSNHHIRRNDDVLSDIASGADSAIFHNVREMPNLCAGKDQAGLVDI